MVDVPEAADATVVVVVVGAGVECDAAAVGADREVDPTPVFAVVDVVLGAGVVGLVVGWIGLGELAAAEGCATDAR